MALLTRIRGGGRRRGAPLWSYLTALVLVPLIGVGLLTAAVVQARATEAASAARAEEAVRALALLDAARSGVEKEVLPALSLVVLDDPAALSALGVLPALATLQRGTAVEQRAKARAATDEALAAARGGTVGAAAADRAVADLSAVRAAVDDHTRPVDSLYLSYLDVSNELMNAERAAASAAVAQGVPARTLRASQDVLVVAQLVQSANRSMGLFLGSRFAGIDSLLGTGLASQTAWLEYTDAQRRMDDLSQTSLRAAWATARTAPAVTALDSVLSAAAGDSRPVNVPVGQLVTLMFQSGQRDQVLGGLVERALEDARSLAAADRRDANDRVTTSIALAATLLLLSLVGALWLGRRVSRTLRVLAGHAREISQGDLVEVEVAGPREVRTVSTALGDAAAGLRRIQDQAHAVARGDLDNALLAEPLPGRLGEVVHASVRQIVTSVRERQELQFALAHQATHDSLTQLPNRAQALTLTTSALHRGRRSGSMTGLLFVDLDGFKTVNDRFGHARGDEVLREVARRLREAVRPGDAVCRLGGDEFVVLVEAVVDEHDLMDLAERLIATASEPMPVGGAAVRLGASIGVAVSRDGDVDADVLVAEAGTAAGRAKDHGRGRAEIFDDTLREQLAERAALEAALTAALADGEMRLHYQPVVDLATGVLVGFEALVRWERPGVGMVPPDRFIPVAESSRLVCELDRWVLGEATRQLAEWLGQCPDRSDLTVAVNVSGRHLTDGRIVDDVLAALDRAGLPADRLVLEVTETVLVDDPVAYAQLAELRALGVTVALDDFGTGYTSIGQLRDMPVDTLKIDRSFVASTEPGHEDLVALMVRTAHTFGLSVVAEGVEQPGQLATLRALGCDHAQGYLMSRPLPATDAGALLRSPDPVG